MPSLVFPLDLASFLERLPIKSIDFDLPETVSASRTEGGQVLTDTHGVRLWQGEVVLDRMLPHEARSVFSLIDVARGGEASFLISPLRYAYPANDPDGTGLSGANPEIRFLDGTDARRMALQNMPVGYTLSRGDLLSFQYASNPTRYALHRIVDETLVATGLGNTVTFEVRPHIEPGALVGTTVTLIKPHCKAVILPGSLQPGRSTRFMTEGVSFQFQQTLR